MATFTAHSGGNTQFLPELAQIKNGADFATFPLSGPAPDSWLNFFTSPIRYTSFFTAD